MERVLSRPDARNLVMRLFACHRDSRCFLRLLANWGLGLAGLPLAVDEDEERGPPPALPLIPTHPPSS